MKRKPPKSTSKRTVPLFYRMQRYEQLKAEFTGVTMTPSQYAAACRRAARIAGV